MAKASYSADAAGKTDSQTPPEQWYHTYVAKLGRPLRVLHIGNIANNAYNIAKIQRRFGIAADVMCYDYYHIMGTPEWEDADIDEGIFVTFSDQFFPDWSKVDLRGFQRPSWFVQGPFEECVPRLLKQFDDPVPNAGTGLTPSPPKAGLKDFVWIQLDALKKFADRSRFRSLIRGLYKVMRFPDRRVRTWFYFRGYFLDLSSNPWGLWSRDLVERWHNLQPGREPLRPYGLLDFRNRVQLLKTLLPKYDLVQCYGADPWWPMLCGHRPYIGYEHGTLRELPFQPDLIGQLTYLGYHGADHVFVTNGDCRENAERIAAGTISPMLHGIDDSKYRASPALRESLQRQYGAKRLYLCPIRHDWEVKGTHHHIHAAALLAQSAGRDFRVFMTLWGNDIKKSKELAKKLSIEDVIVWLAPLPRRKLIRWVGAMDCVLDQIRLPHFGATAPEALGCGTPVIMSYKPDSTAWIIKEPAPILSAWTPAEIRDHLIALADETYRQEMARRGRDWFQRHHSCQRILDEHLRVYGTILAPATAASPPLSGAA